MVDLQWEFIDWDTWEFLPDEQIDSILEQRLLESENNIRTMLGAEQVTEPTDFYPYRYNSGDYEVTLIGAPSYIQNLDIAAEKEKMELPLATSVNYIASGAFFKMQQPEFCNDSVYCHRNQRKYFLWCEFRETGS